MKTIAHIINNKVAITYIANDISIEEYCLKFLNDRNYIEITQGSCPDIFFRDAWELKDKQIIVNINLAKTIWYDAFRLARKPLLAVLDIDFMRAVEAGNTTLQSQISAKKQALRDVTVTELPDTLEGIKSTWPEILGSNPHV